MLKGQASQVYSVGNSYHSLIRTKGGEKSKRKKVKAIRKQTENKVFLKLKILLRLSIKLLYFDVLTIFKMFSKVRDYSLIDWTEVAL